MDINPVVLDISPQGMELAEFPMKDEIYIVDLVNNNEIVDREWGVGIERQMEGRRRIQTNKTC